MNRHKCPQCKGFKVIFGWGSGKKPRPTELPCELCRQSGLVSDKKLLMVRRGKFLKNWRIKQKLTLREASRKYNIDAGNLSKMERGIINPYPYFRERQ